MYKNRAKDCVNYVAELQDGSQKIKKPPLQEAFYIINKI